MDMVPSHCPGGYRSQCHQPLNLGITLRARAGPHRMAPSVLNAKGQGRAQHSPGLRRLTSAPEPRARPTGTVAVVVWRLHTRLQSERRRLLRTPSSRHLVVLPAGEEGDDPLHVSWALAAVAVLGTRFAVHVKVAR